MFVSGAGGEGACPPNLGQGCSSDAGTSDLQAPLLFSLLSLSLLSLSQWGKSSVLISEITGKAPAESELRAAGSASPLHFWYYSSQQPSEL